MSEPTDRLIFDRTQQDVDNDTEKGQHNVSDLNRVETWCEYLADKLTAYGYVINITTKTNWTQFDKRKASEMERIRSNIRRIMEGYHYLTSIEPNAEFFNYVKANNWEKILDEINMLMQSMSQYFVFSGVANVGQPRLWQNKFRHSYTPYTRISHIEGTGTQYIDTGIKSQVNLKVEMQLSFIDIANTNYVFGTLYNAPNFSFGKSTGNRWAMLCNGTLTSASSTPVENTTYNVECYMGENNQYLKINGETIAEKTNAISGVSNYNLYIFARDTSSTITPASMRLYNCKIWIGDTLVRDFVPVLDDNNVACLYDTITDGLFYNAGTGNFNY